MKWERDILGRRLATPIEDRFWASVQKGGEGECWTWKGRSHGGYPAIYDVKRPLRVSRIAWQIANKCDFPAHLYACHRCDHPWCVNPEHIWPGTQLENVRDAIEKGRLPKPAAHCKAGHEMTGANLKKHKAGFICRACFNSKRKAWRAATGAKS